MSEEDKNKSPSGSNSKEGQHKMPGVSLKPSTFVDSGGAVPVDKDLLWKSARFHLFDYTRKDGTVVGTTCAAEITYVDDDDQEYVQQYSVGDPKRFQPSDDEKTLVAVVEGTALSKSSNFSLLLNALVNSGFPENRLSEDISTLAGMRTHNIGIPEPVRSGLAREVDPNARPKVISVPSQVLQLPGEKKGNGATAAKGAAKKGADTDTEAISKQALEFVAKQIDGEDSVTRQQLAQAVFKDLAKDPNRDAIASLIFAPAFQATLLANGYSVDGEEISKN